MSSQLVFSLALAILTTRWCHSTSLLPTKDLKKSEVHFVPLDLSQNMNLMESKPNNIHPQFSKLEKYPHVIAQKLVFKVSLLKTRHHSIIHLNNSQNRANPQHKFKRGFQGDFADVARGSQFWDTQVGLLRYPLLGPSVSHLSFSPQNLLSISLNARWCTPPIILILPHSSHWSSLSWSHSHHEEGMWGTGDEEARVEKGKAPMASLSSLE